MDQSNQFSAIVKRVLQEYADYHLGTQTLQAEVVFDDERGHYLVGEMGWDGDHRVDAIYIHVDLVGDMVWLQRNRTDIRIAEEMVKAGIPRNHIVLGFKPPYVRPDTDYAVA